MEKNKLKIAVVTTFHQEGLKTYAQRMIDTFCEYWPANNFSQENTESRSILTLVLVVLVLLEGFEVLP